jgi:hypothetical protein
VSNRRQFLAQTGIVISSIVAPGAARASFAKSAGRLRYVVKPVPGTWTVTSTGNAPWSARDLAFSIEIDGQIYLFARPATTTRAPAQDTEILGPGEGTQYVLPREGGRPTLRVVVTAYGQPPRLRFHYEVQNDTGKEIRIGTAVIRTVLSSSGWEGLLRVFINSGAQGFSGSRALNGGADSTYLGLLVPRIGQPSLLTGFISYRRAEGVLSFKPAGRGRVGFAGSVGYNNLLLPRGQTLLGEDLELLVSLNPHQLVEGYADEVARMHNVQFNRDLTGMWNLWYAYWDPKSSQVGEKEILESANVLSQSLKKYGIIYISTGVWQNRAAFGERNPWPGNFPDGLEGTARLLRARGLKLMSGGFMAKVSSCTEVFQRHPEWLIHDGSGKPIKRSDISWGACHYPYYDLDITHPQAAEWFRDWVTDLAAGAAVDYFWMDFEGTGAGSQHDATVCAPFETDRRRIGIVREALGAAGKIGTYTSPTNRYLGLVDRVRLGSDAGGINLNVPADERWKFLMTCMRNMSAGYFYHGKFWWNDPDPGMPGDQELPETLEEGRCRMLYAALTGSFVTIGQRIPEVAPSRLRLLKMSLPPIGIAARPLDLFSADVAGIYDWRLQTEWDEWHVLTLINWDAHQERVFSLQLADLGIRGTQWVYELWTDHYAGDTSGTGAFTVPPRACRVFVLRPQRDHPWFLATDLHVGMGFHELRKVRWDASAGILSGVVERPPDMQGQAVVAVPCGWRLLSNRAGAKGGSELLRIPVDFANGAVSLSLQFERG